MYTNVKDFERNSHDMFIPTVPPFEKQVPSPAFVILCVLRIDDTEQHTFRS